MKFGSTLIHKLISLNGLEVEHVCDYSGNLQISATWGNSFSGGVEGPTIRLPLKCLSLTFPPPLAVQ